MDKVNIYTYTDIRGPRKKEGYFAYLLEVETEKGAATLHKIEKVKEPETENRVQMLAVVKALRRLTRNCNLAICTHSPYVAAGFEQGWVCEWEKRDWKTGKGEQVANRTEWEEMAELLNAHEFTFSIGKHQYSKWMEREIGKEKEKCLKDLENLEAQRR